MIEEIPGGKDIDGAITKHMDRRFLSSIDLAGQGDFIVTIESCKVYELLTYKNGNSEKKAKVMYFKGISRPLVLNVTNITSIIRLLKSNNVKDWIGKKITLYVEEGRYFGKEGFAVRIKGAKQ